MNKYLKLGKFTISIPVALTGFLGYFMARPFLDLNAIFTVFGIFLLSLGSAALNQIQERHTDAKMKRTAERPLRFLPWGAKDFSVQKELVNFQIGGKRGLHY